MGESLIFRKGGGETATLPILDNGYPLDQSVGFISGTSVSAAFEAKITTHGTPASYRYQWYVNDNEVAGASGSTYVWSGSSKGTYSIYCTISNKAGSVTTRTATLVVDDYYPPTLNGSYPQDATVEYGTSSTFSVSIATAGKPASYTYQWYKDGSAISGATSSSYTVSNWTAGTYYLNCVVSNSAGSVTSRSAVCNIRAAQLEPNVDFTYTGSYQYVQESDNNWHLILKTSGTLTFYNRGSGKDGMDVFMVGGGAGGCNATNFAGGAGGGGGYTTKFTATPSLKTGYSAVVGGGGSPNGAGGTTSIFSTSIGGGQTGIMGDTSISSYDATGGNGGSGGGAGGHCWKSAGMLSYYQPGAGGTNGGNGGNRSGQTYVKGGTGQGTGNGTYAFYNSSFNVYPGESAYPFSGGGGGGRGAEMWTVGSESNTASGGNYGGGGSEASGKTNTGGGGGGGNCTSTGNGINYGSGGSGGSGIIIIRNKR